MLEKSVAKLLNEQINKEFYSAYLYLDIANFYANEGLEGFENWFVIQAQEERDHAMLFRQYLLNNGYFTFHRKSCTGRVICHVLPYPNCFFESASNFPF